MTAALLWSNLAIYSLQIGLLVAAAALLPPLLRLRAPHARLAYWHVLLLACLLLPLMRPWQHEVFSAPAVATFTTPYAVTYMPAVSARHGIPWQQAALWLLLAGCGVRLFLLALGLWKLRQYRRHSLPFDTAYDADIRISDEIPSPVTFGFFRPVILVPAHFPDLAPPMQRAVLCHEILHIERRDWLFTMAEELVRAVFWFHAAIWCVLGEIQLAREQAVDRRVVEVTAAREAYLDALLAMSGARPHLDLAPAPLFLRKRHLKERVLEILKEANMSKKRLIPALAAAVAILIAVGWLITGAIPLSASPQTITDPPGVSVNLNGARLMHRTPVLYPPAARVKGIQGTVVVQVKLDSNGEVRDVAVLSGPEELRKAAIQSVLNWHFWKDSAGTTHTVNIDFTLPQGESVVSRPSGASLTSSLSMPPSSSAPVRTLKNIEVVGLSDEARDELLLQLPVHVGDAIGGQQMLSVVQAVHNFDPHLSAALTGPGSSPEATLRIAAARSGVMGVGGPAGGVTGGVLGGVMGGVIGAPPGTAEPVSNPQRIRVGGGVQQNMLVSNPAPEYPPLARQARISGTVELSAIIGKDGRVLNLSVIKGHPLLVQPALDAVQHWVYRPTLLNGQPVEVSTTIDVTFSLSDQ